MEDYAKCTVYLKYLCYVFGTCSKYTINVVTPFFLASHSFMIKEIFTREWLRKMVLQHFGEIYWYMKVCQRKWWIFILYYYLVYISFLSSESSQWILQQQNRNLLKEPHKNGHIFHLWILLLLINLDLMTFIFLLLNAWAKYTYITCIYASSLSTR